MLVTISLVITAGVLVVGTVSTLIVAAIKDGKFQNQQELIELS